MSKFAYGDRVVRRGNPNLMGEIAGISGDMARVGWDYVDVRGKKVPGAGSETHVALSQLINKTRRGAESRSTGYCSVCHGPHKYKHGRA